MDLLTARLRLRDLVENDAEACNAYERLPEVARYQSKGPRTLAESLAYIREVIGASAVEPRTLFDMAVTMREGGELIGRAGLAVKNAEQREGAIWYVLHPSYQGQGYATEAVRPLIDLAFGRLKLHRVYADIDPRNAPSVEVVKRLGMRMEAHFRENFWCKGEWTDSLIFGLLEREWARRE
jgi:RimJ/RimL family protein N-acetyltransferase